MRRTIRLSISVSALLAVLLLTEAFTCTSPQQAQAGKLADAYAESLKAIDDAIDSALISGRLTPEESQHVYQALLQANIAGLYLNRVIRGVAEATNPVSAVQAAVDQAIQAIDDGVGSIKNPETKATVMALATTAKDLLGQIAALYAPKDNQPLTIQLLGTTPALTLGDGLLIVTEAPK